MKNKKREISKNIIKKLRLTDAEWSAIESLDRVGLKIIADDNAVLRQIYEMLGK